MLHVKLETDEQSPPPPPARSLQMDVGVVEWSKQQAAMQGGSSGAVRGRDDTFCSLNRLLIWEGMFGI